MSVLSMLGWSLWNDLWFCSMTTLAARNQAITYTSSCLPRKVYRAINGHLPPMDFFLQHKLPPTQASWSLITQAYQSGHSWGPMMFAPPQHPSQSDWGKRKVHWTSLPKRPRHIVNSSSVNARKCVGKEGANVPRHHFNAWLFTTAVDYVLRSSKNLHIYTCVMFLSPEWYFSSCYMYIGCCK